MEYWGENTPCDRESDQSRERPGWRAEQEGHSWVIPKSGSERGEVRAEREGDDNESDTSRGR